MGLRQSRGRVSIRRVFTLCECRRHFDLEISADISTTGRGTFHRSSCCSGDRRISVGARSRIFRCVIDLCRANRLVKRLDHLLGSNRLVWCTRCIHVAAMDVVGSRTCAGRATNQMAIPLARAFRLSPRHRWISLHRIDAAALDRVVIAEITDRNSKTFLDCANARRRSAWFRSFRARVAGAP